MGLLIPRPSTQPTGLSLFSAAEIAVLASIKDKFQRDSATQISKKSHQEAGYQATKDGELISYKYAQALQI